MVVGREELKVVVWEMKIRGRKERKKVKYVIRSRGGSRR